MLNAEIVDFIVAEAGGLFRFEPKTHKAQEWIKKNIKSLDMWDGIFIVTRRYAKELAEAMINDGLLITSE